MTEHQAEHEATPQNEILDALLLEEYGEQDPAQTTDGPWACDHIDKATWASRKLAALTRQKAEADAWRTREIERINAVHAKNTAPLVGATEYFTWQLGMYLQTEIAEGRTKGKSITLAGGMISTRAGGTKINVEDEAAFIKWCEETNCTDLLRVKTEANKTELKNQATQAEDGVLTMFGEVVEGAKWEQSPDSISFKAAE